MSEKKKYFIRFGLGGGFGGANLFVIEECVNDAEAGNLAWELAASEYENYDGMYGLRSIDDIINEDDVEDDEAYDIWNEEREGWLEYTYVLYDPKIHDEIIEGLS